jgi:hypothetical protein
MQTAIEYKCTVCGATGVKLWRQYQTFLEHINLLCGPCALNDQKLFGDTIIDTEGKILTNYGIRTDSIGWLVPAIPDDTGTFWGYLSVPSHLVDWWRRLPLRDTSIYDHEESFDKIMPFVVGFTAACLAVVYVVLFCIINKVGI